MEIVLTLAAYWWNPEIDEFQNYEFQKGYIPSPESPIQTVADIGAVNIIEILEEVWLKVDNVFWRFGNNRVEVELESFEITDMEECKSSPDAFMKSMCEQGWNLLESKDA